MALIIMLQNIPDLGCPRPALAKQSRRRMVVHNEPNIITTLCIDVHLPVHHHSQVETLKQAEIKNGQISPNQLEKERKPKILLQTKKVQETV